MNKLLLIKFSCLIFLCNFNAYANDNTYETTKKLISSDYKNFYSYSNLKKLGISISLACIIANTSADNSIQNKYQHFIRSEQTDYFSKITKPFGNGKLTVPILLTTIAFGELFDKEFISNWASKTIRSMIVGVPPMLIFQRITGASRPTESNSKWHFFNDDNGVSGHSYMGATPFLIAANISTNRLVKLSLYTCSTFTGISRINDNKHYFSQAFLGWSFAYLSTQCVFKFQKVTVSPAFSIPDKTVSTLFSIQF